MKNGSFLKLKVVFFFGHLPLKKCNIFDDKKILIIWTQTQNFDVQFCERNILCIHH